MDQQGLREDQPNKLSEVPSWPITWTENVMYARQVSMELRPNSQADFTRRIESEILPLLRKQKGFQDEITIVDPAGKDAFAVSLWDSKAQKPTIASLSPKSTGFYQSWLKGHRG